MFHGLTMVNFDGQTQNQMMVRPWSTMVDHGRPWSDGQTVAGADHMKHTNGKYFQRAFKSKFSCVRFDTITKYSILHPSF